MPFTADSAVPLTSQQLQQVQAFLDAEDYPGGYRFLRDTLVEIGTDQRVAWLDAASHINANDGTFWSEFVRGSTLASGDLVGRPITEAQFDEASAALAARLLTRVLQQQAIPSTSSIIQLDVQAAVEGLELPAHAWSGTLGSPFIFFENTWTLFSGATPNEMGQQFATVVHANLGGGLYRAFRFRELGEALKPSSYGPLPLLFDLEGWTSGFDHASVTVPRESPLVVDLDGDGIGSTAISAGASFDHNADGFAEATGWINGSDGFLVLDRDADGRIESGRELFGTETLLTNGQKAQNGFAALAEWDLNTDGRIDSSDAVWSSLQVWQDANGDGNSTQDELLTLSDAGIQSIGLAYSAGTGADAQGNTDWLTGSFTRTGGATGELTDYLFATNSTLTVPEEVLSVPAEVALLPDVMGYGKVHDLHQAMVRDTSGALQSLIENFSIESSQLARNALLDQIILKWAGTDSVNPTSRGNWADARKLAALEAFMGRGFIGLPDPGYVASSPNANAWGLLLGSYTKIAESVYGQLMAQTHLKPQFESFSYSWDSQAQALRGDLTAVKAELEAAMASDFQVGVVLAGDFIRAVKGLTAEETLNLDSLRTNVTLSKLVDGGVAYSGTAGADSLRGSAFGDFIFGNAGGDSVYGDAGDDLIDGGAGDDGLTGAEGDDTLIGRDGADSLGGGTGDDSLDGGEGNDWLDGDAGADVLNAGAGNDTLYGDDGADTLNGDAGDDILYGLNDVDTLNGGDGADKLAAGTHNDVLNGGDGADIVFGGAGDDVLDGGAGNDALTGGDSSTNWQGQLTWASLNGLGNDTYLFGRGSGQDTVHDYDSTAGNVDRIVLGADVLPEDVTLRLADGLILTINGTTDRLNVISWNIGAAGHVERIEFANGTVWDEAYLSTLPYTGTEGDDYISASQNADTMYGLGGHDSLQGNAGNDLIDGGAGNDGVDGGEGNDTLIGGDGADGLYGRAGDDSLDGGAGNDWLGGDAGADVLNAGEGNDTLHGHDGADTLNGDAGDDILYGLSDVDTLNGGDGADKLAAGTENDVLNGGDGADIVFGGAGDDVLDGGAGNDALTGGDSSTNWQGQLTWASLNGLGNDTYLFGRGSGQDTVHDYDSTAGNVDRIVLGADVLPEDVTLRLADGLILTISGTTDKLTVTSWNAGVAGHIERVEFANGTVWDHAYLSALVHTGTEGDDYISASPYADTIYGLDGHDSLHGNADNDVLDGGAGNDGLNGGDGNDILIGGDGFDTLIGDAGDDSIDGGLGNDFLRGGAGVDTLTAGAGNDTLHGDEGADTLNGDAGDDVLYGWSDADTLNGGDGADRFAGGEHNDLLSGGDGADTLYAGAGDDVLDGGAGNDNLCGGDFHPVYGINAWAAGNGLGNDTYIFGRGAGQDSIVDYDGTAGNFDRIQFTAGVSIADVEVSRSGNNMVLTLLENGNATSDVATILEGYNAIFRIEQLRFADGTVVGFDDLVAGDSTANTLVGSANAGIISGLDGNDTLSGGAGNDAVHGGSGTDVLNGEDGSDVLYGGSGSDTVDGGAGDDYLAGGTDDDGLSGASGNDVLQGGSGNDTLNGGDGSNLLDGGTGADTLNGGSGSEHLAGGAGDDTVYTGDGHNVISYNAGGGLDTVYSTSAASNTLSFGGGISYSDLSFSKDGDDLVINAGSASDKLRLKDWYAGGGTYDNVANLQVILDATSEFDPNSSDPLYNGKVQTFDMWSLVNQFNQAMAANPELTSWELMNGLSQAHAGGSNSAALGGDIAYWYGRNNGFAGIGNAALQQVLGAANFGLEAQALRPFSGLQEGLVKLS